jgi:hypothetical protein
MVCRTRSRPDAATRSRAGRLDELTKKCGSKTCNDPLAGPSGPLQLEQPSHDVGTGGAALPSIGVDGWRRKPARCPANGVLAESGRGLSMKAEPVNGHRQYRSGPRRPMQAGTRLGATRLYAAGACWPCGGLPSNWLQCCERLIPEIFH